jgi:hypothetical protein
LFPTPPRRRFSNSLHCTHNRFHAVQCAHVCAQGRADRHHFFPTTAAAAAAAADAGVLIRPRISPLPSSPTPARVDRPARAATAALGSPAGSTPGSRSPRGVCLISQLAGAVPAACAARGARHLNRKKWPEPRGLGRGGGPRGRWGASLCVPAPGRQRRNWFRSVRSRVQRSPAARSATGRAPRWRVCRCRGGASGGEC